MSSSIKFMDYFFDLAENYPDNWDNLSKYPEYLVDIIFISKVSDGVFIITSTQHAGYLPRTV